MNPTDGKEINLLLMGLDSRVDIHGNELSPEMYEAIHAGEASAGGLNSNVLMFIHIPADGSKASIIAIPRDDYVDFPGCYMGVCKGKIKEAYGHGFQEKADELARDGKTDAASYYQQARDAGRRAEIETVQEFLNVRIDHFVEVTMAAFFQIAEVVQPITVCLQSKTSDEFSGADFEAGQQQISARQAMAFVRQRRDTSNSDLSYNFTDLDRSRRQQAFMISLLTELKNTNFFVNPKKVNDLAKVAQQNMVIDERLKLTQMASLANSLKGSKINFFTLPVKSFGIDPSGSAINVVDIDEVRSIVQSLLNQPSEQPSGQPDDSESSETVAEDFSDLGSGLTISVTNSSGYDGWARELISQMADYGFAPGLALTGDQIVEGSAISYGVNASSQAQRLAAKMKLKAAEDSTLPPTEVRIAMGSKFASWPRSAPQNSPEPAQQSAASLPSVVDGTDAEDGGPAPSDLTQLVGGAIPCVK